MRTMLRNAERLSERTRASTDVPGNQSRIAIRRARPSHVVLKAESPREAWKRRKSSDERGQAYH